MRRSCVLLPLVLFAQIAFAIGHVCSARPLDEVLASKTMRVAVYEDNAPFSYLNNGKPEGIDVDIAHALGKELGVEVEIVARMFGEDVNDDLRFNVWKGPLTEGGVADVMLHVPVDRELRIANPEAMISNAYFQQTVSLAINRSEIPSPSSFDVFTEHKIGTEYATVADYFLLRYGDGKLINNIAHFTKLEKGVDAFVKGETAELLGVRSDIEGMLHKMGQDAFFVDLPMPGLANPKWYIGTAVREDSRDLGYAIGSVLEKLRQSGELKAIFAAHGVEYVFSQ